MLLLDVRPEAELDALEAASWYDGEREGLGAEFLAEPLDEADRPDDLETSDRYLAIPHKNDLDLGGRSALA